MKDKSPVVSKSIVQGVIGFFAGSFFSGVLEAGVEREPFITWSIVGFVFGVTILIVTIIVLRYWFSDLFNTILDILRTHALLPAGVTLPLGLIELIWYYRAGLIVFAGTITVGIGYVIFV